MKFHPFFKVFLAAALLCGIQAHAQDSSSGEDEVLVKTFIPELSLYEATLLPILNFDETIAYTTIKYFEDNVGGMEDEDDIWRFERDADGNWQAGKNIGPPVNTWSTDVAFACSADGNTVLVAGNYNKRGYRKAEGYSITRWDGIRWTTPEQIYIKNYINNGPTYMASIAGNGLTMTLSIMGPDSHGELDLYMTKMSEEYPGTWETPINLGDVINGDNFDAYPHLAADTKTLYFTKHEASNGYGNADIYMTRRLDDSWQKWSEPVNLGLPINTEGEDISPWLSLDGKTLYYVSSKEGITETGVYKTVLPPEWRPEPYAYLSGQLNADDAEPTWEPRVRAYAVNPDGKPTLAGHSYSTLPDGKYGMTLTMGREYLIEATAPGYPPEYTSIDLRTEKDMLKLQHDFFFKHNKASQEVLSIVYFNTNDTIVGDDARIQLRKAVVPALSKDGPKVEIVGHADDQGSEKDNLRLSMRRAKAVARQLESLGVDYRRLTVRGLGESEPANPGEDPESRKANRRVEIFLVYDGQAGG